MNPQQLRDQLQRVSCCGCHAGGGKPRQRLSAWLWLPGLPWLDPWRFVRPPPRALVRHSSPSNGKASRYADSRRTVPLHPALIAEGFLNYVDTFRPILLAGQTSSPMRCSDCDPPQPAARYPDGCARRWASLIRLSAPTILHWFIGACRKIVMPIEVRSAITGHSAKMDESAAYGDLRGSRGGLPIESQAPL